MSKAKIYYDGPLKTLSLKEWLFDISSRVTVNDGKVSTEVDLGIEGLGTEESPFKIYAEVELEHQSGPSWKASVPKKDQMLG